MNNKLRQYYLKKLKKAHAFWSYDQLKINTLSDEVLIENVFIHLDMDDIILLFRHFPRNIIKKVWLERLVRQEPMFHNLNNMIALLFFNIKNPERYLAISKQKILKSLSLC